MTDLRDPALDAETLIHALDLQPHPEGGHYRETWRDPSTTAERGAGTAILFLLKDIERSHWHRVDSAELWVWQAGTPLLLTLSPDGHGTEARHLGPAIASGQSVQCLVPARCWQSAQALGPWTLVTCVVAPAFHFEGFELAPPNWRPSSLG